MPRVSDIPFVRELIAQSSSPDYIRGGALVVSKAFAGGYCARGLFDIHFNYEAAVVGAGTLLASLYHACDELLWCPTRDVRLWERVDDFAFFTTLGTAVIAAGAPSQRWQVFLRVTFIVMNALLVSCFHPDTLAAQLGHAVMWTAPLVALAVMLHRTQPRKSTHEPKPTRTPNETRPEAIVGAAGLFIPGLMLHFAGISTNLENPEEGAPVLYATPRGLGIPRTAHFWLFHTLFHIICAGSLYLVCLYRTERPAFQLGIATPIKAHKRQARLKWWLAVLLQNLSPAMLTNRRDKQRLPVEKPDNITDSSKEEKKDK